MKLHHILKTIIINTYKKLASFDEYYTSLNSLSPIVTQHIKN
jgi:hypothetical protein